MSRVLKRARTESPPCDSALRLLSTCDTASHFDAIVSIAQRLVKKDETYAATVTLLQSTDSVDVLLRVIDTSHVPTAAFTMDVLGAIVTSNVDLQRRVAAAPAVMRRVQTLLYSNTIATSSAVRLIGRIGWTADAKAAIDAWPGFDDRVRELLSVPDVADSVVWMLTQLCLNSNSMFTASWLVQFVPSLVPFLSSDIDMVADVLASLLVMIFTAEPLLQTHDTTAPIVQKALQVAPKYPTVTLQLLVVLLRNNAGATVAILRDCNAVDVMMRMMHTSATAVVMSNILYVLKVMVTNCLASQSRAAELGVFERVHQLLHMYGSGSEVQRHVTKDVLTLLPALLNSHRGNRIRLMESRELVDDFATLFSSPLTTSAIKVRCATLLVYVLEGFSEHVASRIVIRGHLEGIVANMLADDQMVQLYAVNIVFLLSQINGFDKIVEAAGAVTALAQVVEQSQHKNAPLVFTLIQATETLGAMYHSQFVQERLAARGEPLLSALTCIARQILEHQEHQTVLRLQMKDSEIETLQNLQSLAEELLEKIETNGTVVSYNRRAANFVMTHVHSMPRMPSQCDCIFCFGDKERESVYLPCFHVFHSECIQTWLHTKPQCPVCQHPVLFSLQNQLRHAEYPITITI